MPSRYDETLDRFVQEYGVPEDEAALFRSNKLREELEEAKKQAAEAQQAKAELERLRKQPKVAGALKEFGIDMESLNPRDKAIVAKEFPAFEDAPEKEKVAEFLQTWGFEANVNPEPEPREKSGAEQITDFLTGVGPGAPVKGAVTPKDFASWDMGRQRDFIKKNPRAYEQLKRGEEAVI